MYHASRSVLLGPGDAGDLWISLGGLGAGACRGLGLQLPAETVTRLGDVAATQMVLLLVLLRLRLT